MWGSPNPGQSFGWGECFPVGTQQWRPGNCRQVGQQDGNKIAKNPHAGWIWPPLGQSLFGSALCDLSRVFAKFARFQHKFNKCWFFNAVKEFGEKANIHAFQNHPSLLKNEIPDRPKILFIDVGSRRMSAQTRQAWVQAICAVCTWRGVNLLALRSWAEPS